MPYFPRLIQFLVTAPYRVCPDGTIVLSPAEADMFQACDFVTAAPGLWPIPPIPAHAAPDWLFRVLPQLTRAAPAVTPSQAPTVSPPTPTWHSTRDLASTTLLRPTTPSATAPPTVPVATPHTREPVKPALAATPPAPVVPRPFPRPGTVGRRCLRLCPPWRSAAALPPSHR